MLPVTVELHIHVVTVLKRVFVPRLHGAAYSEVLLKVEHRQIVFAAHFKRVVGRSVVDDDEVIARLRDRLGNACDISRLVVGGNDQKCFHEPQSSLFAVTAIIDESSLLRWF